MRIAVLGEALIDFTATGSGAMHFAGHEGGSPLNTAVACARMGAPTAFVSQLSTDLFGERLMHYLAGNGVDLSLVTRSAAPSTLAFVERTPQTNRYAFYTRGSADATWAPAPLPRLPDSCRYLHFGSLSLLQDPAAGCIIDLVKAHADRCVIVFDPNVRVSLIADLPTYRRQFAAWMAHADILKLSDEDAELIAPGKPVELLAADCLAAGVLAVIVTRGGEGATLYRSGCAPQAVTPPRVAVVDTIGAGDTFTAGLSVGLLSHGVQSAEQLAAFGDEGWADVLRFASVAAALNCTREGADPPSLAEVQATLRGAGRASA